MSDPATPGTVTEEPAPEPRRDLPPAARRALAEAAERRAQEASQANRLPPEVNGPSGPEPTRYGDWEINGRCIDF